MILLVKLIQIKKGSVQYGRKNLINITEENIESIKHIDENEIEYWYARELMQVLGYSS